MTKHQLARANAFHKTQQTPPQAMPDLSVRRAPVKQAPVSDRNANAVRAFVNAYWKAHCGSPSMRDIMAGCNISSISVVSYTVHRLAKTGEFLLAEDGQARGITPVWVVAAITNAGIETSA